jgi:hypothetical protein
LFHGLFLLLKIQIVDTLRPLSSLAVTGFTANSMPFNRTLVRRYTNEKNDRIAGFAVDFRDGQRGCTA